MMISQTMTQAMNRQVCAEFGAMLQYVAIASYFAGEALPVLSGHFFRQANEEREHALKFVRYLLDTGASVELKNLPNPQNTFNSAEEAVQLSLKWEQDVTRMINDLMALAIKENDYLSQHFLQWFVQEQLEEVSSMDHLLRVIQRAGEKNVLFVEQFVARLAESKAGES
jgi:ferritin